MEHADFAEQDDADARARVFFDLRAQRQQKRLDLAPTNAAADRVGENRRQGGLVALLHVVSVPQFGTIAMILFRVTLDHGVGPLEP